MAGQRHKPYPIVIRELEVSDAFDVTPLMRRVVLAGGQLGGFHNGGVDVAPFLSENADDHVKLLILDPLNPDLRPPAQLDGTLDWTREALLRTRDYTPRRYDLAASTLELDFVRHRGGLAAGWAVTAKPGDRVHVAGPRGTTVLPDGIDWYLLVGDETALPAIARRVEELPAGTPVTAVVSIASMAETQEWHHACDLDITWVPRDTCTPQDLQQAIESARWRDGQVYAWAAGEAGMLRGVRAWLKSREVPREYVDIAGYWRKGQAQDETAEMLHELSHQADLALPYALRAAVTLSLAEHVLAGHTTIDRLAGAAGVRPRPLRKVLDLLAYEGFFELDRHGTVAVTPRGQVLSEDHVHARLDHGHGYARLDDGWPGLLHTLRTGEAGFPAVEGRTFWDALEAEPGLSESFDESLADWAATWTPAVVGALSLGDAHVVDVGGGTGALLAALLDANPGATGTLVERDRTSELAVPVLQRAGVADRVTIAEQSFFDPLPAGGVIVLAQVLHDWPDRDAIALLDRARRAGPRVVLIERLCSAEDDDHSIAFDLTMTVVFGSGERTLAEYEELARHAGLSVDSATRVHQQLHLLELG